MRYSKMYPVVLGIALATLVNVTAGTASAAPLRLAADAALLGLSGGAGIYPSSASRAGFNLAASGQALRLGVGVETENGLGLTAGTRLVQMGLLEMSLLPVTVRAFKDFDPDRRWRRRTAYVLATYHWMSNHGVENDVRDPNYVELGCGVAWTFALVTPKAELLVRTQPTSGPTASLQVGFDIGGAYVFGKTR